MTQVKLLKLAMLILLIGILVSGYGGMCQKDKDDETGSSGNKPAQVTSPTPANNATNIPITTTLSWAPASGATSYDVYFGMSSPGTLIGNQTGTTYTPATLSYGATYYWRIDSKNPAGTTTGNIWSFTTQPSPTPAWTRQLGTSSYDGASDVATDSAGNVYVVGSTNGGLDGNTNSGLYDLFVVKYDSAGLKQWTRQLGTSSDDYTTGVATDSAGNCYVAGGTEGGLDGNTNSNSGYSDLFVLKYAGN